MGVSFSPPSSSALAWGQVLTIFVESSTFRVSSQATPLTLRFVFFASHTHTVLFFWFVEGLFVDRSMIPPFFQSLAFVVDTTPCQLRSLLFHKFISLPFLTALFCLYSEPPTPGFNRTKSKKKNSPVHHGSTNWYYGKQKTTIEKNQDSKTQKSKQQLPRTSSPRQGDFVVRHISLDFTGVPWRRQKKTII